MRLRVAPRIITKLISVSFKTLDSGCCTTSEIKFYKMTTFQSLSLTFNHRMFKMCNLRLCVKVCWITFSSVNASTRSRRNVCYGCEEFLTRTILSLLQWQVAKKKRAKERLPFQIRIESLEIYDCWFWPGYMTGFQILACISSPVTPVQSSLKVVAPLVASESKSQRCHWK